ncbi:hypothetical protein Cs7R123_69230 [Catellatospora sp. TT07R-123]|uniref:DUF4231 domain-containing protein n=1 Tax=Catellatospora sp. TT07R-123 TaxID=2733863 RepID=UPI001B1C9030|nr:DUF4231 domain-containing protein [Catellatospora sp. TT07R-123]GHJ49581.1 hypothetical protein Cs7R123_69230 [Catellatospora sp. TT07R-123]
MADGTAGTHWWQRLTSPGGGTLPLSVTERLSWYERQVRKQRRGNHTLEATTVVLAAGIPAAAALGAPAAVTAVLGALVAVLAGLRQLLRPGENWIRSSGTLVALQREAVLWSAGRAPYDGDKPDAALVENVEALVADEAMRWADQRSARRAAADPERQPA